MKQRPCMKCGKPTDGEFECVRAEPFFFWLFRSRYLIGYLCRPCVTDINPAQVEAAETEEVANTTW